MIEIWFGTHPSGVSDVIDHGAISDLLTIIKGDSEYYLGKVTNKKYNGDLPFLLKILSIRSALSIQVHPDKKSAESLHKQYPEIYKDANHKPEVAIALTPMTLMCGFRQYNEIVTFLTEIPEFSSLIDSDTVDAFVKDPNPATLKNVYIKLMHADNDVVKMNIQSLVSKIKKNSDILSKVIMDVYKDYETDIGLFSLYIFNLIQLKEGQAVYLGPNIPHSYISGDCIECMATSDNVVRAGLTPKFKDVDTLINLLDFKEGEDYQLKGVDKVLKGGSEIVYKPPVEEFEISKITLNEGSISDWIYSDSPSILIVIEGEGDMIDKETGSTVRLSKGVSVFLSAGAIVNIVSKSKLIMFKSTTSI